MSPEETTESEKPVAKTPAKPAAKPAAKKAAPKTPKAESTEFSRRRGKRYAQAASLIEPEKAYPAEEAVSLVKKTATANFDATIELHLKLGLDPKNADENIRGIVKLPAGTGKERKVMAFVPEAQQAAVKKAGADFVSDEATLKKIAEGWAEFDVAVATPDQMQTVAKYGKALGPKGLMPNPKAGTVTDKPAEVLDDLKKGTIEFRLAKDSTVHAAIGKASFAEKDLLGNLVAYFKEIQSARPDSLKGNYIRSVTLASTMGPGVKVSEESLRELVKAV